jgi:hypothetical protein
VRTYVTKRGRDAEAEEERREDEETRPVDRDGRRPVIDKYAARVEAHPNRETRVWEGGRLEGKAGV